MWLILLGMLFLYFVIMGNLWGIIILILCTAVVLPGFRQLPISTDSEESFYRKREEYKQGDIYGNYSDPLALLEQKKEREKLEMLGRERI